MRDTPMRFLFFFFNSALLSLHFALISAVLSDYLPFSTKTQESDLYGSTLLVVEFSSASAALANLYVPLVLLLALVLGIFSRRDNKLDRKFFFRSERGSLEAASF